MNIKTRDYIIIGLMALVAACGLIYEYAVSHYAGIVLGQIDKAIYGIIGVMLVSSGIGAALSGKVFKDPYKGFVITELLVAFFGAVSVLITATVYALSTEMPKVLANIYGLEPEVFTASVSALMYGASLMPVVFGFIIGFLIGMEIPLIVRIREDMYGAFIKDNFGTMYGADYAGAGVGAAVWVFVMLSMSINSASWMTASMNVLAGIVFTFIFLDKFSKSARSWILIANLFVIATVAFVGICGEKIHKNLESMMYSDGIEYSLNTKFQHISISKRKSKAGPVYKLYINGKTQFSSDDEGIYHDMLVYPVMEYAKSHENVLIIGGGDGLAARNVLSYDDVKSVTLIDLDPQLIHFFKSPVIHNGRVINDYFLELNKHSFSDKRMHFVFGDAFVELQKMRLERKRFDVVIVDLPDPSHPNLNKLYSTVFYGALSELLNDGGGIVVQSTSPYHARKTFISIGKTFEAAGMHGYAQYHHNVPSFGEWGWTIWFKGMGDTKSLIDSYRKDFPSSWLTYDIFQGSLAFGKKFYFDIDTINPNHLSGYTAYQYYQNDWQIDKGIGTFLN